MKTVSKQRVFVDTNILFYANNPTETFGIAAITKMNMLLQAKNELVISSQIIREYVAVTLRNAQYHKLPMPATVESVKENVAVFRRDFTVITETNDLLDTWLSLLPQITTSKDVFDFNIVATIKNEGISHILTHNVTDFRKFDTWLNVIPLL
jgi:predicted nucleic acid-binding protein